MQEDKLSFEDKLQKAKTILEKLMDPNITLQESVKAYEDGIKELDDAQKLLEDAQLKIKEIKKDS